MSLRDFLSSPVWAEMLMFNLLILFWVFFSSPGVYLTWASVAWLECYANPARTRAETNDSCCYLKQRKRLNICTTLARPRASPHFYRPLRPLDLVFALPTLAAACSFPPEARLRAATLSEREAFYFPFRGSAVAAPRGGTLSVCQALSIASRVKLALSAFVGLCQFNFSTTKLGTLVPLAAFS